MHMHDLLPLDKYVKLNGFINDDGVKSPSFVTKISD